MRRGDRADTINALMGAEGYAARQYVVAWKHLLSPHAEITAPGVRSSRPATDPLNAALSFGYGLLRIAVHGALDHVGLDPFHRLPARCPARKASPGPGPDGGVPRPATADLPGFLHGG